MLLFSTFLAQTGGFFCGSISSASQQSQHSPCRVAPPWSGRDTPPQSTRQRLEQQKPPPTCCREQAHWFSTPLLKFPAQMAPLNSVRMSTRDAVWAWHLTCDRKVKVKVTTLCMANTPFSLERKTTTPLSIVENIRSAWSLRAALCPR